MDKARTLIVVLVLTLSALAARGIADERVKGYTRSNGTYVQPHYRSWPDGNPYNNYSYPGNVNPHTGKRATGDPDVYLRDHGYNPALSRQHPTSQDGW